MCCQYMLNLRFVAVLKLETPDANYVEKFCQSELWNGKQIIFPKTFAMSTDNTTVALSESEQVAVELVEEFVAISLDQIIEKDLKSKCVAVYYDALKSSLKDIFEVYEKPKPRKDHSSAIEAWKRDKPAKPSKPDILSIGIV